MELGSSYRAPEQEFDFCQRSGDTGVATRTGRRQSTLDICPWPLFLLTADLAFLQPFQDVSEVFIPSVNERTDQFNSSIIEGLRGQSLLSLFFFANGQRAYVAKMQNSALRRIDEK